MPDKSEKNKVEIGTAVRKPIFGMQITPRQAKQLSSSGKEAQDRRTDKTRPPTPPKKKDSSSK